MFYQCSQMIMQNCCEFQITYYTCCIFWRSQITFKLPSMSKDEYAQVCIININKFIHMLIIFEIYAVWWKLVELANANLGILSASYQVPIFRIIPTHIGLHYLVCRQIVRKTNCTDCFFALISLGQTVRRQIVRSALIRGGQIVRID